MNSDPNTRPSRYSRRRAITLGPQASPVWRCGRNFPEAQPPPPQRRPRSIPLASCGARPRPREKLRIATCQFSVSANVTANAKEIRDFMRQAADGGAHLLHTSEASLSGYAGTDLPSFQGYDWNQLRRETSGLRQLAKDFGLWLVLGSAHFLDEKTKPTNCLYLIDPDGQVADRYDKSMCTSGDQKHYSAGNLWSPTFEE